MESNPASKHRPYSAADIREAFQPSNKRRRYLEVEAALAMAQGELGMIPADAAQRIAAVARTTELDAERLNERIREHGHSMMALVEVLAETVGEHGGWVHWGATTQNIQQTGDILILRDVHGTVTRLVDQALVAAADLIDRTADVPMPGRTHGQHAVPITFGLKVAAWSDQLVRHHERLAQLAPRLLRSMTGGAAGTFASFGAKGIDLQARVAEELGLEPMPVPSRAIVDHLTEFVLVLGLIATTAQSVGEEVQRLRSPEFGEASEPAPAGQVGSSTMPQKRTAPMASGAIIAGAHARAAVPLALESMLQSHEVDGTRSVLLDRALEQACIGTVEALECLAALFRALEVHPQSMLDNLDLTGGMITAEAVMLRLADTVGRQEAHHIVHAAVEAVDADGVSFADALRADPRVTTALTPDELTALLDPVRYTGLSEQVARTAASQARTAAASSVGLPTA